VAASRNGLPRPRNAANITLYRGHARFASPQAVEIAGERLRAGRSSSMSVAGAGAPMPGINEVPYLTNSSMMDVDFCRAISSLSAAAISASNSAKCTPLWQRGNDHRNGAAARSPRGRGRVGGDQGHHRARGRRCEAECECISLAKRGDEIIANVDCTRPRSRWLASVAGSRSSAEYRRSRSRQAGCAATSVLHRRRRPIANHCAGVWASRLQRQGAFTHTPTTISRSSPRICSTEIAQVSERITAYALYIDPPLGRVGMTLPKRAPAASSAGRRTADDARCPRRRKGRDARIYAHPRRWRQQEILGASLLGTGCDEAVHAILDLMYAKAPYTVMQHAMHIHPTVSELLPTILGDLKSVG